MSPGAFRPALGAEIEGDGVRFTVWAPKVESMAVRVLPDRLVPMTRRDDGVHEALVPGAGAGSDYLYVHNGERERPDPRSRFQPHGVHGPSRVVDPRAFSWTDAGWRGPTLEQLVVYELHTGTFSVEGTFDGIRARLGELVDLGVTAIEVMPVAAFPGARNWGYDGVALFAPHAAYGGPDGLRRLVDACHAAGLAVILDVVYNHLGPEGNYLGELAPYFTNRYTTPWGVALNFDGPDSDPVRRFFIDNALSWLVEYHIDGLRLDAIHSIYDFSARHVLEELSAAFRGEAQRLGRRAVLIAESDLNDVRVIRPAEAGGWGMDAQWSDDFHHALHALVTSDRHGYFADFGRIADLAKAYTVGFVYDGRYSAYRRRRHGSSSVSRPAEQLVICTQNHDQVANGSGGVRHSKLLTFEQQKLCAAALLVGPNVPLLFMGQEYGETAPFLYFTSHDDPALATAVREGRRREHAGFGWEDAFEDPQAETTFAHSKLDPTLRDRFPHAELLRLHRDLLALRRRAPALRAGRKDLVRVEASEAPPWIVMQRSHPSGSSALVLLNFDRDPAALPLPSAAGGRWDLALWTGAPHYGGPAGAPAPPATLALYGGAHAPLTIAGHSAAIYLRSERA